MRYNGAMATRHERFVWDDAKAAANSAKHGVSFDDAAAMMVAPLAGLWNFEDFDAAHAGDEDRWITAGPHPDDAGIVLRVVWTDSADADGRPATRIITARKADNDERDDYRDRLRRNA